jgi:D-3-phosphoglycerate dehydrogenase
VLRGYVVDNDAMGDAVVENLIADLLQWVASGERSYEEVMEAWRTSCPKLPVWEDANDRGLVAREEVGGRSVVRITAAGRVFLDQHRESKA